MADSRPIGTKAALSPELSAIVPWVAVSGLVLLVLDALAIGAGDLLQWFYPLATFAVGVLLYWRYPVWYLGFAWWLWFLTPEVRRLADYQNGFTPQSLMQLAPFLVTGLTFFTLLRHLPKLESSWFLPFGLVIAGVAYGYGIGLLGPGPFAATYDLLNWLVPVVFAFHLAVNWRSYPRYRRAIRQTFVWGVVAMGSYGVLQFLVLPGWDRYWMLTAEIASVGAPEPFQFRIFSTLNSPGPFAIVMMAGLLLLFDGRGSSRWLAVLPGYVAFLLGQVRSAWVGWAVGAIFIAVRGGIRFRLRTLLAVLLTAGLVMLPVLTVGPIADMVGPRLQSLGDLQDGSLLARLDVYRAEVPNVARSPLGDGLGSTGLASGLASSPGQLGGFDSGILNTFISLGWIGTALYAAGVAMLLVKAFPARGLQVSPTVEYSIVVSVSAQIVFGSINVGLAGMLLWGFLGLALAGKAYMRADSEPAGAPQDVVVRL